MVSLLQVDGLGKRYGLLPSEVLKRGTTFDLYVLDCAMSFEDYHLKKANNKGKEPLPDYDTDQLLNILNKGKLDDKSKR